MDKLINSKGAYRVRPAIVRIVTFFLTSVSVVISNRTFYRKMDRVDLKKTNRNIGIGEVGLVAI